MTHTADLSLMPKPDCEALLQRIARDRDAEALAQLFKRYQKEAFCLALLLSGDSERAEDAVQQAMLSIWNSAVHFRPGNARAWILQIVANEGRKVLRDTLTRARHTQPLLDEMAERCAHPLAAEGTGDAEALATLRTALQELPALDRQLVALYYGVGGISQEHLGRALGIPQRTVSTRLNGALKALRERMRVAGFSALSTLSVPEAIAQAVCSGSAPPPDLIERGLTRLRLSQPSAPHPPRIAQPTRPLALLGRLGLGLTFLACILGGTLLSRLGSTPAQPTLPTAESRLDRTWSFEAGPEPSLVPRSGSWVWMERRGQAEGAMHLQSSQLSLVLPIALRPTPIEILVAYRAKDVRLAPNSALSWQKDGGAAPHRHWLTGRKQGFGPQDEVRARYYLFDRYIAIYCQDQLTGLREYETPYPSSQVILWLMNQATVRIRAREIAWTEIPAQIREPTKLPASTWSRCRTNLVGEASDPAE